MPRGSVSKRTNRDGSVVYRVRVWIGGERVPVGNYPTEAQANAVLRTTLSDHAEDAGAVTLESWGERWLDLRETDGAHRSLAEDRSRWKRHIAASDLAPMALRRIKRRDVVEWMDALVRTKASSGLRAGERLSYQTARHAKNLLHRCLHDALTRDMIAANPASGVEVPAITPQVGESWAWLTLPEIAELLSLPGPPEARARRSRGEQWLLADERAIYTVAIYTGLRRGELWALTWRSVTLDGPRPELLVAASNAGPTKSGRVRRVPLLGPALEALRMWRTMAPGIGDRSVFPSVSGGQRRHDDDAHWPDVVSRLGFDRRVRFHDLRHTCASHLIQGSWTPRPLSLMEVRLWLGHSDLSTTTRYAHLAPDALHIAARGARGKDDANQG